MKFLCLADGDAKDWNALSKKEQDELLEQDQVLRRRIPALKGEVLQHHR